ncbi:hypothetical protein FISHEDRAFT_33814 [Fistulina hepatica ATCC 64428]|uniref:Uncharacterized protein n=1 Tax=Fistulina hepatica ATCC 64428 TaxID=1128425 RepID=A0A0D7AMZ1_9AGAR|nr:hypothetical protein FISHEDRAFT_33814 [Fistulina hepatica ATCC 64428]
MDRTRAALRGFAQRTGTPLAPLLVSFAVIHEITAVIPLIGVFYAARSAGVGESICNTILREDPSTASSPTDTSYIHRTSQYLRHTAAAWIVEGDRWTASVGTHYGLFGYPKLSKEDRHKHKVDADPTQDVIPTRHMAGDVANAVVAYVIVKALLPARIALSVYLSPAGARAGLRVWGFVKRAFKR